MFDTKAVLFGLICYGYGFYQIAEKIRYYKDLQENVYTEQENFKLRWTNPMMNKLIEFKDTQIERVVTERSRHSWAKGKMVQFFDDFKVRLFSRRQELFKLFTKGIQEMGMNANDLVQYMKKRKYEEKTKSLLTDQQEVIQFELLNKTIDVFDVMKPQFENMVNEELVDSWKAIQILKVYQDDLDGWFKSEKVRICLKTHF